MPGAGTGTQFAIIPPRCVSANSSLQLSLTSGLPAGDCTVGAWVRQPNGWTGIGTGAGWTCFNIWNGGDVVDTYFYDDPINMGLRQYSSGGSDDPLVAGTPTGWIYVCFVRVGTVVTIYYRLNASGALSSLATVLPAGALTEIRAFSYDAVTDQATTTRMRALRVWNVALSSAQVLAESKAINPVVTANLNRNLPLVYEPTAEKSTIGAAATRTGTGTTVTDAPNWG